MNSTGKVYFFRVKNISATICGMSIDPLYPYAGTHAVQNAIFAVEWAEPLRSDVLLDMLKLATKYRNLGLTTIQQQNALSVNLTAARSTDVVPNVSSSQELGGLMFSAAASAAGVAGRSITISRQNCMVFIPDYTRWAKVWDDVHSYLSVALGVIAPMRPLTVAALQYTDVFQWKDDPSDMPLEKIFRNDTYMPPNIFSLKGLWHVHQGYIQLSSTPVSNSRLENLNVDMLDTGGLRSIQITGAHRATLSEPLWQAHLKNAPVLTQLFRDMHESNKDLLARLLTTEVCAKISLNEQKETV